VIKKVSSFLQGAPNDRLESLDKTYVVKDNILFQEVNNGHPHDISIFLAFVNFEEERILEFHPPCSRFSNGPDFRTIPNVYLILHVFLIVLIFDNQSECKSIPSHSL